MGQTTSHPKAEDFPSFLIDVQKANDIGEKFRNEKNQNLRFVTKKEADIAIPAFWRLFCDVTVTKCRENVVLASKTLSCGQFYKLLSIMSEYENLNLEEHTKPKINKLQQSFNEIEFNGNDNECPICLEREPDIVYSCSHTFCNICTSTWEKKSSECPMCREIISPKDSWVLLEGGDSVEDISKFFDKFIGSL